MVKGLDLFTAHFTNHVDQFVLIGGAACDTLFDGAGVEFRATKDLDLSARVSATGAIADELTTFLAEVIADPPPNLVLGAMTLDEACDRLRTIFSFPWGLTAVVAVRSRLLWTVTF